MRIHLATILWLLMFIWTIDATESLEVNRCDQDWRAGNDKVGNPKTCQRYIDEQWCTENGDYGTAWRWGSFNDYANVEGQTARVCPQCGCGRELRNIKFPSMTESDIKTLQDNCGCERKSGPRPKGNVRSVQQMIYTFGAKQVVQSRSDTVTCLHCAAKHGHFNIVKRLLEYGAEYGTDVDPKTSMGFTPLSMAIYNREYSCITALIKFGASVEKAKEDKWSGDDFWDRFNEERTQTAIARGLAGPQWDLKMEFRSNSTWSDTYAAKEATKIQVNYWCSAKDDDAPIYWRMSFRERPVQIVKVEFEEKYSGAEFEFFASSDTQSCNADKVLIKGKREDISGIQLENDQSYPCYGLKVTQLANTASFGPLVSVKNFDFFLKDESFEEKMRD